MKGYSAKNNYLGFRKTLSIDRMSQSDMEFDNFDCIKALEQIDYDDDKNYLTSCNFKM